MTPSELYEARHRIAETRYEYTHYSLAVPLDMPTAAGGTIRGWLNGTVEFIDGRVYKAGGGWVDLDGSVEPYNYRDAGDVDALAAALHLDVEDTLELLRADCPRQHEEEG